MPLLPDEWDRLEFLLGKDHVIGIDHKEMEEIKALIRDEYPDTDFKDREKWIEFGIIMVGSRLLVRQIRLTHPPNIFRYPEKVYADVYDDVRRESSD